jgi:tRNA A37 threonylcarbamoyladenosine dehydratase
MKPKLPPQFERTQILLGDDGIAALRSKHVFVAGLGGVGSYCTEALARAGIGRLTLMDHDVVAISNINRQLPALLSTVGQSKAELMRARIADINPDCVVTLIRTFLGPENVHELVPGDCDFVIDCIDSMNCKVALVSHSVKVGMQVASSMGAGNKLDPSRIRVADISETSVCPLAREMRKHLRDLGIKQGVLTVYTDESPRPTLPPQPVTAVVRVR